MTHVTVTRRVPTIFSLLLLLALLWGHPYGIVRGQGTEVPERLSIYGYEDDEFYIGGWATKWALSDTSNNWSRDLSLIWPYVDSMGLNLLWTGTSAWEAGQIYTSLKRQSGIHRFRTPGAKKVYHAGFARSIRFFPFDSVQLKYTGDVDTTELSWYFFSTPGGTKVFNSEEEVAEKSYSDVADIGLVASGVIFHSADTITARTDSVVMRGEEWFLNVADPTQFYSGEFPETHYVTVIGHLAEDETPDGDTVFTVAVYHEIPAGQRYLDDNFDTVTNGSTRKELLVDSFAVADSDLYDADQYDRLSEISHAINLRYRLGNTSLPGPRHPNQPRGEYKDAITRHTWSIDVRVYWTGEKEASLHAVAWRDSVGELVVGETQASINTREAILDNAKEFLYRSSNDSILNLRTDLVALECSTEPHLRPYEFAGFQTTMRLLKEEFNLPDYRVANNLPPDPQQGDSIGVAQFDVLQPQTFFLTEHNRIHTEFYWDKVRDTIKKFNDPQTPLLNEQYLELPLHQIPRVRQRNGGRFHLPELLDLDSVGISSYDATLASRISQYDEMVQRLQFGRYDPGNAGFYYEHVRGADWPTVLRLGLLGDVHRMAVSAQASRETGKPWIPVPGCVTFFSIRDSVNTAVQPPVVGVDTISSPNQTESEIFANVGMMLGYGARGILWYNLISFPAADTSNGVYVSDSDGQFWGSNGYYTKDTMDNVFHPLELKKDHPWNGSARLTVPDFYVGWRDATRAIKKINRWIARIGPELLKLRWREGYSMHFATPWSGKLIDTVFRPYDTDEIISGFRTRSPFSQAWDSAHKTFLEVGFFDEVTDTTNPILSKQHVFLTNRRTFRKPIDTCWSGYCDRDTVINGDTVTVYDFDRSVTILDTLAGTRVVEATLNLEHPDTAAYNYWRVREIEPDVEALPHQPGTSRWVLDTIVHGDSAITLVLGPGRSTLLEMSPTYPDSSLVAGDLRFPGQKKFMFDGKRYHALFHTSRTLPMQSPDNVVVWRMSLPLTDTTGAIRWLNDDIVLSDMLVPGDTLRADNRFASMTLKRFDDTIKIHAVWTAHPAQSSPPNDREVLARNIQVIEYGSGIPGSPWLSTYFSPLHTIDWHAGTDAEVWGTPVVSMTDGATLFAWSDSVIGIVGRLYPYSIWNYSNTAFGITLSARDSISWISTQTTGFSGKYPSMPPYTRLHANDSTVGIVWQQPRPAKSQVMFNRLQHTTADALVNVNPSGQSITPGNGFRYFPSIDLNQDTSSATIDEGVAWEDDFLTYKTVYFQALMTDATSQLTTQTKRSTLIVLEDDSVTSWPNGELYPQGASIGAHDTSAADSGREQYAVAYSRPVGTPDLWLSLVFWDSATFHGSWPQQYSYGGAYPNTLYDATRTWSNSGLLYQNEPVSGTDSTVRTSRQFYAKFARPTGYVAQGRSTHFRVSDSLETGYQVMWYDPWRVTSTEGAGLSLVDRSSAPDHVDSLTDLEGLFETGFFDVSDTVVLGFRLDATFDGDSLTSVGTSLDCLVELVDSASGMVVDQLDSVRISPEADSVRIDGEHMVTPAVGTYSVRVRFVTAGFTVDAAEQDALYPVWEVAGRVNTLQAGKVMADGGVAGDNDLQLSVRPNPVTGKTRVVVAVKEECRASVNLLDPTGSLILSVAIDAYLESGVHVYDMNVEGIPSGTYLLELRAGKKRVMRNVVILQ